MRLLSVVIPAFNEAERLPRTLAKMRPYLDAEGEEYEVIVVDDGSSDGTAGDAEVVARDWPELSVIRLPRNQGKGAAVRAGMLAARGEYRLFSDADLSTPISELHRLREHLGGTCQVAIASRGLAGARIGVHQPRRRELMGRMYNVLVRLFAVRGIKDTQCGFKVYTGAAACACFEPLRTLRFGFDVEVLLRARGRGWTIAEVPVEWNHVEESRVGSIRDSSRMLYDLTRARLRARRT